MSFVNEQFIIFLVITSLWSSWREKSFVRLYGYTRAREIWNFKIVFSLNFISSRKLKLKLCTQNVAQNEWIPFGLVAGCWAGILAYAHGLTLMNFLFQFFASGQTISRERLLLPTTKNNHWFKENYKTKINPTQRALTQGTLAQSYKVVIVIDVLERNAILPRESDECESNKWTNWALNFMLLSRRRRHFQEWQSLHKGPLS